MESLTFTARVASQIVRKRPAPEIARFVARNVHKTNPVFVKFAQIVSVRTDVVDEDIAAELALVQDRCVPIPMNVPAILNEDFPHHAITNVRAEPIGAASLAQVYLGRTSAGTEVAIKVARDINAAQAVLQLRLLSALSDAVSPGGASHATIVQEYSDMLDEELDFRLEAAHAREMKRLFADTPWVRVPAVLQCSRRCIVYEYVPGASPTSDLSRFRKDVLARRVMRMYLRQVFDFGFFHADMHPGNVAFASDGAIVMYDFGMMGDLDPYTQGVIRAGLVALIADNYDDLVAALKRLGVVRAHATTNDLAPLLGILSRMKRSQRVDPATLKRKIRRVSEFIQIPSYLVFWFRSGSFVQSLVSQLDPDFDYIGFAFEYVQMRVVLASITQWVSPPRQ